MRIDRVVVNASPLICLYKSGPSQFLPELFSEIVVRDEVYQEITAKSGVDLSSMKHINRVGNIIIPQRSRRALGFGLFGRSQWLLYRVEAGIQRL